MTCKRKEDIYILKLLDQNKVTTGLSFIHACKKKICTLKGVSIGKTYGFQECVALLGLYLLIIDDIFASVSMTLQAWYLSFYGLSLKTARNGPKVFVLNN